MKTLRQRAALILVALGFFVVPAGAQVSVISIVPLPQEPGAGYREQPLVSNVPTRERSGREAEAPSVSPAFDTACAPGCDVLTCSCTNTTKNYWSSSSYVGSPSNAWVADFAVGLRGQGFGKSSPNEFCVRAVRGGV